MPMIKKGAVAKQPIGLPEAAQLAGGAEQPGSGAAAAIERLNKEVPAKTVAPAYKQRDYDAEARGKVKCVMFEAALQSPAIAGLRFDTIEEFLKLVEKAADAGVVYTWK